ncbi:glycerol kinase GlpK [Bythopirellula polymerisocia]|uniref:Glycerol kinase n=1 Tax=Bythopirellula polymerisocia TaxID=2528003 RepID=A0A5C6CNI5_9BACT|nr:glycerol kinase GlpK [Bythopirellula polymerisocia]TWU26090.1 Glycerol kinase [Bythopirellula polymerisocia]
MPYLLALDQGTTSSRAIIFSDAGDIKAIEQNEFKQYYPQPGWVEHDPEEIWQSQLEVVTAVLDSARLKPADISALGITNQRETTVVWDRKSGQPIHPAIVWQDRRTADVCQKLRSAGHLQTVREKTGLLLDPYFSGTKIAWILDHVPSARKLADSGQLACGTIDTWLVNKLTGGSLHITDVSNASRTLLMNIHTGDWDNELLELFRIPRSILPEIRPSSEIYGEVDSSLQLSGMKIGGIAGDQQSALFGQSCFEKGATKNTYGTGCFMLMNTSTEAAASQNNLLTTVAWKIDDKIEYALEGSVFVGGAVVSWLRDGLGVIKSSSEVEALASSVPDSGGVFLVPAFAGLGAPHWDPYARGTILGITGGTTAAHIARAAIESIVFQVADLLEAMRSDTGVHLSELRVDGGASVNNAMLQFQADILQLPVVRPTVTETTALGAAYLAGLASGVWGSREDIAHHWKIDQRFEPQMLPAKSEVLRARWQEAVDRTKNWEKAEPSA